MKTAYKPRWRNAIKGAKYNYDDRLGNIVMYGMNAKGNVSKPVLWYNSIALPRIVDDNTTMYDGNPLLDAGTTIKEMPYVALEVAPKIISVDPLLSPTTAGIDMPDDVFEMKQIAAEISASYPKLPDVLEVATVIQKDPETTVAQAVAVVEENKNTPDVLKSTVIKIANAFGEADKLSKDDMSGIYIAGAVAIAGILALIFKN